MRNKHLSYLFAGAVVLTLIGCGKEDESAPPPVKPQNVSMQAQPAQPAVPPPTGAATMPTPEAAPADSPNMDVEAARNKLIEALQNYYLDRNSAPASLDELVTKGYLKAIPPAPTGKKWALQTPVIGVKLEDQ